MKGHEMEMMHEDSREGKVDRMKPGRKKNGRKKHGRKHLFGRKN